MALHKSGARIAFACGRSSVRNSEVACCPQVISSVVRSNGRGLAKEYGAAMSAQHAAAYMIASGFLFSRELYLVSCVRIKVGAAMKSFWGNIFVCTGGIGETVDGRNPFRTT